MVSAAAAEQTWFSRAWRPFGAAPPRAASA